MTNDSSHVSSRIDKGRTCCISSRVRWMRNFLSWTVLQSTQYVCTDSLTSSYSGACRRTKRPSSELKRARRLCLRVSAVLMTRLVSFSRSRPALHAALLHWFEGEEGNVTCTYGAAVGGNLKRVGQS